MLVAYFFFDTLGGAHVLSSTRKWLIAFARMRLHRIGMNLWLLKVCLSALKLKQTRKKIIEIGQVGNINHRRYRGFDILLWALHSIWWPELDHLNFGFSERLSKFNDNDNLKENGVFREAALSVWFAIGTWAKCSVSHRYAPLLYP